MKNKSYTIEQAESLIREYCSKHQIRLNYPDSQPRKDEGASCCRTIWIGKVSSADNLIEIFCHELGHIQMGRKKSYVENVNYVREFGAWYQGFVNMRTIFGINPQLNHAEFAAKCLKSYAHLPDAEGGNDNFWYDGK